MQQYSLENQQAAIREYAQRHGFHVVKTYVDAGRTGVVLRHRDGLGSLLKDVVAGQIPYKAILVYDVSRWGRFQDCDEAAHYEFVCKTNGVPVHYCAEQFGNTGTVADFIWKSLKRSMAAEYSRELGVKCFNGQKRLVELGFRMGAPPGYGLRRMLVSERRKPKHLLGRGEYKSIGHDRVILVPGPERETKIVRQMYSMALDDKMSCTHIARKLDRRRIPPPNGNGKTWDPRTVQQILTNPKYAGWNVWGRTDLKLHRPPVHLSPDKWIKQPGAFVPIVNQETFDGVQRELRKRAKEHGAYTDLELLKKAKRLLESKGYLDEQLLGRGRGFPAAHTFYAHFGSLANVYRLLGYEPPLGRFARLRGRSRTIRFHKELADQVKSLFPDSVEALRIGRGCRLILQVDHQILVSVAICFYGHRPTGRVLWTTNNPLSEKENMTLVARLNESNDGFHDFWIIPKGFPTRHHEGMQNDAFLYTGKRLERLNDFYDAVITMELRRRGLDRR